MGENLRLFEGIHVPSGDALGVGDGCSYAGKMNRELVDLFQFLRRVDSPLDHDGPLHAETEFLDEIKIRTRG